jgi:hypothetical protein
MLITQQLTKQYPGNVLEIMTADRSVEGFDFFDKNKFIETQKNFQRLCFALPKRQENLKIINCNR